jgi:hypothetical protein
MLSDGISADDCRLRAEDWAMPDNNRTDPDSCNESSGKSGPVREAGGTTGAGNVSAEQADRTGGATSGVPSNDKSVSEPRRGVKPDA